MFYAIRMLGNKFSFSFDTVRLRILLAETRFSLTQISHQVMSGGAMKVGSIYSVLTLCGSSDGKGGNETAHDTKYHLLSMQTLSSSVRC